ncbi:hypothetical protein WA026_017937 [Henosepilachna vigintioctopunctata]|uniref:TIL domain-containing protein n=1 Tax=Henosepilachna vigintioctopunctata TaxID=420089 RepID=A0AAW1TQ60_9CUCU
MLLKVFFVVGTYVLVEASSPPCEVCGPYEEWSEAISLCPATCEFQHPPCYINSFVPQPGCQCKNGYIFLSNTQRKCVKYADCPKKCSKPHFVWNDCGTRCPSTCVQPGPRPCVKICERGCFCKEGYILDDFQMECVRKEQCPIIEPYPTKD